MEPRNHVLVVENSPVDARATMAMLEKAPSSRFEAFWADSARAALARLAAGGIDVILLDLFLEDSQGLETLDRVRAAAPDVPVLVVSSLDDDTVVRQAARRGAQEYLVKSDLSPGVLERFILYALERCAQTERQRLVEAARGTEGHLVMAAILQGMVEEMESLLTAIVGHATLVAREAEPESEARRRADEIESAARRLDTVVGKLRALI
ncbi:MAG: response regulator [Armatimonadetes bacterium]|nr:response regulator [Armatimonadota bacterium]